MTRPKMDKPIRTLDDLPASGLIFQSDFLSTGADPRLIPIGAATWRRRVSTGELPPVVRWLGRLAAHSEHVRAVATGVDWRTVDLPSQYRVAPVLQ